MATIYDVEINQLIEKSGLELQKVGAIMPPEWAISVKTGIHKERPPYRQDWWYVRAAAILRSVYILGPIGVSKLRQKYGGRKNRGYKPERFKRGSGNILRKILQQLEKAGFIKQTQIGNRKGRIITPAGKSFLDKVAGTLYIKLGSKEVKSEKSAVSVKEATEKIVETANASE